MIVRCGRCRAELEIAAPGEFICPACGTRNAVRDAPVQAAGGLTVPGGGTIPSPFPQTNADSDSESGSESDSESDSGPDTTWAVCPVCRWRFAHGESETLTCPSCRTTLSVTADGLQVRA